MAFQPERPEGDPKDDSVDVAINARLTRHLMGHATRDAETVPADNTRETFGARLLTMSGIAFLMSILGIFYLVDRRQRLL
ncbi:hypothetical protein [Rhizobium sp. C1]|uniref:hypothetical protein n=1 Tax=Rhizobium sp. C1 TaxID=1349799 RepID=UPI001E49DD27|nr:hypothetical protein [Rhizobium sp. C1]MCD2178080.1 hypothetical protein [Rhizobium sp. C1]